MRFIGCRFGLLFIVCKVRFWVGGGDIPRFANPQHWALAPPEVFPVFRESAGVSFGFFLIPGAGLVASFVFEPHEVEADFASA